jgi:hypothetical protein
MSSGKVPDSSGKGTNQNGGPIILVKLKMGEPFVRGTVRINYF